MHKNKQLKLHFYIYSLTKHKKRSKILFKLIFYILSRKLNKCFTSSLSPSRKPLPVCAVLKHLQLLLRKIAPTIKL